MTHIASVRTLAGGLTTCVLVMLLGCGGESGQHSSDVIDSAAGGSIRFALAFPDSTDVVSVRYQVTNNETGDTQSRDVPLVPFGLPQELDSEFAGHPFADWFVVLNPGVYTVEAFPLNEAGRASAHCTVARGEAVVFPGETTELLLVSQCSNDSGAVDVVVVIDRLPVITELDIRPSKFVCAGDTANLNATAVDLDGDPLSFDWKVVKTPSREQDSGYCLGFSENTASFSASVTGRYELMLTVSSRDGSSSLRFPIYVHSCDLNTCPGDAVRESLPGDGVTLAGECSCDFEEFDPTTEWPTGEPVGPSRTEELGCVVPEVYVPGGEGSLPEVQVLDPVPANACPDNYCVRGDDGLYRAVGSEGAATTPGCEAFETSYCVPTVGDGVVPLKDDGTRLGCDSAPALGANECEQVELCPDPGDVPATLSQTADPPQFTELPELDPPNTNVPPNVVTIADNLTRVVPPCVWDTLQDNARVYAAPVPAYGDTATGRVDDDPPNFSGLPLGANCIFDIDCQSNYCTRADDFTVISTCLPRDRLSQELRKSSSVNPYYWDPSRKGSSRWNIDLEGGPYAADVHVQGVFYPSVGWDLNAGGDFRMDVTAGGLDMDRFIYINAAARNANCGWSYDYEVRLMNLLEDFDGFELGAGGAFVSVNDLGAVSDSNDDAAAQACENSLAVLRNREEQTNRLLWDTMLATTLWNVYGPSDAVPNLATLNLYRTNYENSVASYQADLDTYTSRHEAQSQHAVGIDVADLDVGLPLWRPLRVSHRMGPFVVAVEANVVGKAGVDVLLKSATDFTSDPGEADVAVGVELTPHVDVYGYLAVSGGVDIFVASVEVGLRGELQFAGLYTPLAVSGGLVRDELPIDTSGFGDCISDATLADFLPGYGMFLDAGGSGLPCPSDAGTTGLPIYADTDQPLIQPSGAIYRASYGYNAGVEGRFLDGAIKAFVRARVLFVRKTWTKTLVEWEGLRRTYLSVGDGDVFANSFNTEIGQVTLPLIGTTVDLWPGPQRDMVFLPDFQGSAGPAGTRSQDEAFYDLLNDSLLLPSNARWGYGSGLCDFPRPG